VTIIALKWKKQAIDRTFRKM